jgi:tRNA pseudouridine55 synthase
MIDTGDPAEPNGLRSHALDENAPVRREDADKDLAGAPMGILNINKPASVTSHNVVARIRRVVDTRRVGHAGTLDPMATGVLVLCLGRATKVAEYIADAPKVYLATVHFGVVTETWDTEGRVLERHDASGLSLSAIEAVLPAFRGQIEQTPPAFSALKQDGQPLYRLARRGIAVQPAPRRVEIRQLDVLAWRPPELVLKVACTKGTYIRSLAHDLGERLGVGAHLSALVRLAVGQFRVEDAIDLDALERGVLGSWTQYVVPLRQALAHLRCVTIDDDSARRLSLGQAVSLPEEPGDLLFAFTQDDRLVAIARYNAQDALWHPHKVLFPA